MAASAWTLFNMGKEYFGDNTIDLDGTTFDLHLYKSGSDAATRTQSTLTQLSSELSAVGGYTASGKVMVVTWVTGASASERRFDASDMVLTASGAAWNNLRYAVIVARTGASGNDGANKLFASTTLSTANFSVTDGNTLTLTFAAGGVFELN